ncbi:MAG: alpha/beta hydrolase domain-containing protein, partial [Terriglobales bacterium]
MNFVRLVVVAAVFVTAMTSVTPKTTEQPTVPGISGPLAETPTSHAFLASAFQKRPLYLGKLGYIEEEYLISGEARVFERPGRSGKKVLGKGPYVTRILVRRPRDDRRFNGTAIVEPLNPSSPVDLPIMWAESHQQFISDGYAWVGITIKPNTIKSLKKFDPARYATLGMPNPRPGPACSAREINPWAQPTTPADETGLAWDMLSEVGMLLKSHSPKNPLSRPAERLYMTGQSQTGGYSRAFASVFGQTDVGPDGKPLYDAYIYSGSPPWQVPLNQCAKDFSPGDPRLLTAAAGVPIIEMFTQADMGTNVETRRPDSDVLPDLFRRYEIAGAAHVDPWEALSFASDADMVRATGTATSAGPACEPTGVEPSDFPVRYIFDAAWRILDNWVRHGVPAPRGTPLELKPSAGPFLPDKAFVVDAQGNAKGGVRTPYVDVPTARWIGAKTGAFQCLFQGYKYELGKAERKRLYGNHDRYVAQVRADAAKLEAQHWLTPTDAA